MNNQNELTRDQQRLLQIWENHTRYEFEAKNVNQTMKTMIENPYVNHVPTMMGGFGKKSRTILQQIIYPENASRY